MIKFFKAIVKKIVASEVIRSICDWLKSFFQDEDDD